MSRQAVCRQLHEDDTHPYVRAESFKYRWKLRSVHAKGDRAWLHLQIDKMDVDFTAAPRRREPGHWGTQMVQEIRSKYAHLKPTEIKIPQHQPSNHETLLREHAIAQVHIVPNGQTIKASEKIKSIPSKNKHFTQLPLVPTAQPNTTQSTQPNKVHKLSFSDFDVGRIIGAGSFGRVHIAKLKSSGMTLAIKCISKAACIQQGQIKHVTDERKLLLGMDHPFIVKLHATFQDAECIYLVMEFVAGGEFLTRIRHSRAMEETHARFYAANIILALEYMHKQNIVYRDLKPENLLLGNDGYLRLTDMGFAKVLNGKTYTFCGTPDYLAPEIILNRGHTIAVDWWSLGCVIFEMLSGHPPFYTGKAKETYFKILYPGSLMLPAGLSDMAKDLIGGLLQHEPRARLGIRGQGIEEIKAHPWFSGLNWSYIYSKMYKPPYTPTVKTLEEVCNFYDYTKALGPFSHPFLLSSEQQGLFGDF